MILSSVALFVAVGGSLLAIVNHKRLRSSCCGRQMVMSFDVEATTPRDPVGGATPRDPVGGATPRDPVVNPIISPN